MLEVDFVGRVCGLPIDTCSTDKGPPKLSPRPVACFNRFPEVGWGCGRLIDLEGFPADTET